MASVSCSASVRCRQGGTSCFIHGGSRTPGPLQTQSRVFANTTHAGSAGNMAAVWSGRLAVTPTLCRPAFPTGGPLTPSVGSLSLALVLDPSLPRSPGQQKCLQEATMTQAMTAPDKFTSASCCLKTKPLGHQKSCRFSLSESFIFWEGLCVKDMDQRCLQSPAVPGVLASSPPCWLPCLVLPQGHHAPRTHDESAALLNT